MDKSCRSFADSTGTNTNTTNSINDGGSNGNLRDDYLRHLNRLSHKINKPIIKKTNFDAIQAGQTQEQQQNQPPVYNINKDDFRDVVQRLTGSPAHERSSNPTPVQQTRPPSSRLQRIRPPPLAQIRNRPSPLVQNNTITLPGPSAINTDVSISNNHSMNAISDNSFLGFGRSGDPLSPLPPFPTVHVAAESPVSAYMRYLHGSVFNSDPSPQKKLGFSPLAPLVSPRWNNLNQTQSQPEPRSQLQHPLPQMEQGTVPSSTTSTPVQPQPQFLPPPSPFPFGCLNSPKSPYPLLSPSLFLSPTSGQLGFPQLPLSPTVSVPSPKWRSL